MTLINTDNLYRISQWSPSKTLPPEDPKIQEQLTFETKQEYLAWRAEWKQAYADLSQQIRADRKTWRAEGSNHDNQPHHRLFASRALARTMLSLRAASKVKAEALYQASRATAEVA